MIFDCNHVTVCNVQEHCGCQQDLYRLINYWTVAVLSSVDASLAVDSLSINDVYAQPTVSTNLASLACKETVLSSGYCSSYNKSTEGVHPSFQVLAVYSLYCNVFMTQLPTVT